MFICCDFNIDLMKYETHNGTKRFLDCIYRPVYGLELHPLIDRPSQNQNQNQNNLFGHISDPGDLC